MKERKRRGSERHFSCIFVCPVTGKAPIYPPSNSPCRLSTSQRSPISSHVPVFVIGAILLFRIETCMLCIFPSLLPCQYLS